MRARRRGFFRVVAFGGLITTTLMTASGCQQSAPADATLATDPDPALNPPEPTLAGKSADELAAIAADDVQAMLRGRAPAPQASEPAGPAIQWSIPDPARPTVIAGEPTETADTAPETDAEATTDAVVARPEETLEPVPPVPAAESVAEAIDGDRVDELIVELSRELYTRSAYADMPLRELLAIAAQAIVRPDRSLRPNAIPGLTDEERDILEQFQRFCRELGEGLDGEQPAGDVVRTATVSLRDALIERPHLAIGDKAMCYDVGGFGDYRAFKHNRFLAHDEQDVLLYLEIDDFMSEQNEKGDWVTELGQQLIIYAASDGIPVWTADWQPVVDVSRNQRQDFFTVQRFTLPPNLSVGRYHLKVRLRDQRSGAEAETSIEFEMVADPKMVARMP